MARELKPCGTSAAYQRHLRLGEQSCDACLKANAERTQRSKQTNPAYVDRQKRRSAARTRAQARLTREFAARYRELCNDELRKIGEMS